MSSFTKAQLKFIRDAAEYLESPSLAIKFAQVLGRPIEFGLERLPGAIHESIHAATKKSLEAALRAAISTLPKKRPALSFEEAVKEVSKGGRIDITSTALVGALGGAGGFMTLALELPASTVIILRSISNAAATFGFDLNRTEEKLECLSVFSYGGPSSGDDSSESAYYVSRVGLAKLIEGSAIFLAKHSLAEVLSAVNARTAPALLQFLVRVGSRYEAVISRKLLTQAVPGIGAISAAALNAAFASHFHRVALYHFGLRRLEKEFGQDLVREIYLGK